MFGVPLSFNIHARSLTLRKLSLHRSGSDSSPGCAAHEQLHKCDVSI